ncbi:glycosyltransferase family 4 protein [Altericista sp. CCNU0014]|uniref:glycosyltransferase family 4 protein n=1 Tax=Altericista sp. CCNU0014 TaxID=3082949 RepID=UPI00384FCE45
MISINSSPKLPTKLLAEQVFFIGQRYSHHARHSGYEGFSRYVGTLLKPPVNFRWISAKWGWGLNTLISQVTHHPMYSLGAFLTEVTTLLQMLRRRNCLYHLLYGDSDLWLLGLLSWFCHLTGNRLVASFHEPSDCLRSLGIIEKVVRGIDAVILVSESQRSYFEEFLPLERIFVVPHGMDVNFFHPPQIPAPNATCITVGSHLRDFETLKQVMSLVWQANPKVHWIAVGVHGDRKNPFGSFTDERIQFLNGVSDEALREAYQTSQAAIFALKEATANNSLLEAMACGLPVVVTDTGGIAEYVDDTLGILCPPNNPKDFAHEILRILADSVDRHWKAEASRQRSLKYDYRRVAEQMGEIYATVLKLESSIAPKEGIYK